MWHLSSLMGDRTLALEARNLNHTTTREIPKSYFLKKIFLTVLGLYCHMWAFSDFGEWGLVSSCGAWVSHCDDFSC